MSRQIDIDIRPRLCRSRLWLTERTLNDNSAALHDGAAEVERVNGVYRKRTSGGAAAR